MGTRVPVQHYNLRSANSYIGGSLHDLNTVDGQPEEIEGIGGDIDRDGVAEDSLENDEESSAIDCVHESYRNSLPLHNAGLEEDRSSLDNNGTSRGSYNILTIDDVSPIEAARTRFLDIIVEHFIGSHVTEVTEHDDHAAHSSQDKLNKRKSRDIYYIGDGRFALPLMYVANLYETLVSEADMKMSSLSGIRDKTIGVALEAAGGLYRKLAKKFPPKTGSYVFKRRELATSLETRTRFPELVIQEERRVRFVVVNGLAIVEKPTNVHSDDAEWFKRLTGRDEVAVTARDYKFYSPRRKYRRVASNSVPSIPGLPTFSGTDRSTSPSYHSAHEPQNQQQTPSKHHLQAVSHQPQFHPLHHNHCHPIHQSQHTAQFAHSHHCGPPSHLPEITHSQQSTAISQHIACLQPLSGGHVGGRLHVLPTSPAKFCDECGAPYLRETSKFCSECGVKRLGI